MKRERDVKEKCKEILRKYGAWYFMPYQAGFGRPGIPDIIACFQGVFLAIECKFGDNEMTAHQVRECEAIEQASGFTLLIDEHNIHDLEQLLAGLAAAQSDAMALAQSQFPPRH